jgi:Xaa-Pro aminopeptidase
MLEEALPRPPAHVEVFGWHESSGPEAARRLRPGARLGCDLTLAGFEVCAIGVRALRLVLTPAEQERCRVLCRDAGTAIEETAEIVEPGMSELEITGVLAAETYDRGLVPIVVLVATDERVSRYRHPIPTARRLQQYALLVLCARRHGLVANVTRVVPFGATPDDLLRR